MFDESKKDLDGIEQLFTANHKALCNVAYKIVRDRSTAEDIVQDVFLKLWRKRDEIQIESTLKGYLFKAVANAALNELQRAKKIQFKDEIKELERPVADIPAQEEVNPQILEKKLSDALNTLPPRCRAIFILSRYENLKYREIAEQLNISVKTVEAQMGIALEKLRAELKPYITREHLTILFFILHPGYPFFS